MQIWRAAAAASRAAVHVCAVLLDALGAWDGEHVTALSVYPRQRQLDGTAALARCHFLDSVYELQVLHGIGGC